MKSLIKKIINPLELIRAYQFHKNESNHIKASKDLELMLYSKIITVGVHKASSILEPTKEYQSP